VSRRPVNLRRGGHAEIVRTVQVVADPNGNREQRRAARKLGVVAAPAPEPDCARCPHPPHHAGICEAPAADDDGTCGCEETT
jgi:hypothetical protein